MNRMNKQKMSIPGAALFFGLITSQHGFALEQSAQTQAAGLLGCRPVQGLGMVVEFLQINTQDLITSPAGNQSCAATLTDLQRQGNSTTFLIRTLAFDGTDLLVWQIQGTER